jgi:SAM-dependent methyltransferase
MLHRASLALVEAAQYLAGLGFDKRHICSDDRRVLETLILPRFVDDPSLKRILFVGCARYTLRYVKLFERKELWTIDYNPLRSKYGSKNHVVGSVAELSSHFDRGYFDAIIMNGVLGRGINNLDQVERTLRGCHATLRKGGILLVGWNDLPPFNAVPYRAAVESSGLFTPHVWKPLKTHSYKTSYRRHIYDFYERSEIPLKTFIKPDRNPSPRKGL